MKTPPRLTPLLEAGLIDEVIGQLMSGKEATVYIVRSGSELRCAKVYKAAEQRSFRQAVQYREGRKVRNSRRARAQEKGSRYGRKQQEEAWHNAEAIALGRLARAGVRVPRSYGCIDGVLLMELIVDAQGEVAPRLSEVSYSREEALEAHALMMSHVTRMLHCGLVHGDLSEFNVLVDAEGPVIIDLPQAVDAAANNHAYSMLERDINNMTQYFGRYASELLGRLYAQELWALFSAGELHPSVELQGDFVQDDTAADLDGVMLEIEATLAEEQARQERCQASDTSPPQH